MKTLIATLFLCASALAEPGHYSARFIIPNGNTHIDTASIDYFKNQVASWYRRDMNKNIEFLDDAYANLPDYGCSSVHVLSNSLCYSRLSSWARSNIAEQGITNIFLLPPVPVGEKLAFFGKAKIGEHFQKKTLGCTALAWVGNENYLGRDYRLISAKIIAHELGHCLGASHYGDLVIHPDTGKVFRPQVFNIMHSNACGLGLEIEHETGQFPEPFFADFSTKQINERDKRIYTNFVKRRVKNCRANKRRCVRRIKKRLEH